MKTKLWLNQVNPQPDFDTTGPPGKLKAAQVGCNFGSGGGGGGEAAVTPFGGGFRRQLCSTTRASFLCCDGAAGRPTTRAYAATYQLRCEGCGSQTWHVGEAGNRGARKPCQGQPVHLRASSRDILAVQIVEYGTFLSGISITFRDDGLGAWVVNSWQVRIL